VSSPTREVVARYLDALNCHDVDGAVACVADDFYNEHTSAIGTSVRGREAYAARLPQFLGSFRELHYDVEDWIVDADRVAVPYTMRGVVDGRAFRIRGMFRFRVVDGAIVHRVDYWDGNDFERQMSTEENPS
jgi:steroid delta-isomerase-like uncharacterized protein